MARTHYVAAYRGQRTCQHVGHCRICNYPKNDPLHLRDENNNWFVEDGHFFSSPGICGEPRSEHAEADHPFTQAPLRCGYCGQDINIGDPYKWVAPRAHRATKGVKKNRHTTCPSWKPSELTSSPHLATIYAAQESAEDAISALDLPETPEEADEFADGLRAIAEQFADDARQAAESYRESAEAIEEGFQHSTYQSDELNDKADEVDQWCDEVGYWEPESYSGEDEDIDAWADTQADALNSLIYDSPL